MGVDSGSRRGRTATQRAILGMLLVGYVGLAVIGPLVVWQPLLFWTILLPALPVSIVLMGYPNWRRVCPLAAFGELGKLLNRGRQRRAPVWLERWFMPFTLALLLAMLALRLLATNGDGRWLSAALVALPVAAIVTNWALTGKSWCHFVCPVGVVERIYTEPNSLWLRGNSQCARCTACKKHCPDIDQENAFWRDVQSPGRRLATFAFPGLVLGFYTYYWLRAGDWAAYFDGRWTRLPVDRELVLGSGFFFWPGVPALVAAPLSLLAFSVVSYGLFALLERLTASWIPDPERRRHLALALAAFAAFSIFYVFAGAPSLRRVPGATRTVAFAAPMLATVALAKRWRRTREHFIGERGATRLLRNWPFSEPPPDDAAQVYAWIKAGEHAHGQQLAAYESTVREMVSDGLVGAGELRLLEGVREQLGISTREHERLLERLSAEERELFTHGAADGVEARLQLQGYEAALTEALLHRAPAAEIEALQREFGVGPDDHEAVMARVRGQSSDLLTRAATQLGRAEDLDGDLARLAALLPDEGAAELLRVLLERARSGAVDRVLELVEVAGATEQVRALRDTLDADDPDETTAAARRLIAAAPEIGDLGVRLESLLTGRAGAAAADAPEEALPEMLGRLVTSADPYVRAAALWTAAAALPRQAAGWLGPAAEDPNALVRETAAAAARRTSDSGGASAGTPSLEDDFAQLTTIERMQVLRQVSLFADLEPEDLHDLCALTREEAFAGDAVLCREGATDSGDVFVLLAGRVSVRLRIPDDPDRGDREVATLDPGQVIGELALLDDSPRSATVIPKGGGVRVLRISSTAFRDRLLQRPRVTAPLLATLAERLRRVTRQLVACNR